MYQGTFLELIIVGKTIEAKNTAEKLIETCDNARLLCFDSLIILSIIDGVF